LIGEISGFGLGEESYLDFGIGILDCGIIIVVVVNFGC
jgi:hypothetical protein